MQASVLQKNQICNTLSAKKKKPTKKQKIVDVVRTVLSSNNESKTAYYRLPEDLCEKFNVFMSNIFKYKHPKVPKWSEIKNIPREKRKEYRSKIIQKEESHPSKSYFIFGLNAVTKAVEKQTAELVILSDDTNPPILYRHICYCCKLFKIPLFMIKNFRIITKKCFGFDSMIVAIKKVSEDNVIRQLYDFLMSSFPNKCTEILESDSDVILIESSFIGLENDITEISEKMDINEVKQDIYLYRNNKKERCFVPQQKLENPKVFDANFIPFENDTIDEKNTKAINNPPSKKRKRDENGSNVQYQNLKVKKFKKNKDRVNNSKF